jgi:hypothetical protein
MLDGLLLGRGDVEQRYHRVHLDLWYRVPRTKGGHRHGTFTVRRSPDPLHGGAGFDQSHVGQVSAVGPAL